MRLYRKYPNRRLYDLQESHYVTVADILSHVRSTNEIVEITESKSGADITAEVLLRGWLDENAPHVTTGEVMGIIRNGIQSRVVKSLERSTEQPA